MRISKHCRDQRMFNYHGISKSFKCHKTIQYFQRLCVNSYPECWEERKTQLLQLRRQMISKQVTTTWWAHEEHTADLADKASLNRLGNLTKEVHESLKDRGKCVRNWKVWVSVWECERQSDQKSMSKPNMSNKITRAKNAKTCLQNRKANSLEPRNPKKVGWHKDKI